VFSLTDNDTADVLINAKKRGVDVKIITDNDQMDNCKGADVIRLNEQFGIPFKKDDRYLSYNSLFQTIELIICYSEQFMHNKFAVIDGKTVITGSFNWSAG
jgi:phosphatidylserine/phosphatidylglycerophosphate/cardiolipin synthase-like enzyme